MHPIKILILLTLITGILAGCASYGLDDSRNEILAQKRIKNAHAELRDAHINVASVNGIMLITGQAPRPELIHLVTQTVEALRNAKRVYNELTLAGPTSFISRTNDSVLSTKLRLNLANDEDTDASRIRVVTENGVVYLMGLVTRAEADAAVEIAKEIYGVQKIVKVFEYSDS